MILVQATILQPRHLTLRPSGRVRDKPPLVIGGVGPAQLNR